MCDRPESADNFRVKKLVLRLTEAGRPLRASHQRLESYLQSLECNMKNQGNTLSCDLKHIDKSLERLGTKISQMFPISVEN